MLEKSIQRLLEKYISEKRDFSTLASIEVIGLDEISLRKKYREYVTIVTLRNGNKTEILGVLKGREKKTVKRFLRSIPKRLRNTVTEVCSDMYKGFVNAAVEVFKKRSVVVVDRFHVTQGYGKVLDIVRKKELRRIKKKLSKTDYKELKNAMWILRKRRDKRFFI